MDEDDDEDFDERFFANWAALWEDAEGWSKQEKPGTEGKPVEEAQVVAVHVVQKVQPKISWPQPAEISYGTPLGALQLNATVDPPEAGPISYEPDAPTLLGAGTRPLKASTKETDNYLPAEASVDLKVAKLKPTIAWDQPAEIVYGTALDKTQLNATVTPVEAGPPIYAPDTGAMPPPGTQPLKAATEESDNFLAADSTVQLLVKEDPELADLAKLLGADPGGKLQALVKEFGGNPAVLKDTIKTLGGGPERLNALINPGGLDGAGIKKLCDGLGAPLVGAMMGKGNDVQAVLALDKELGGDAMPLKALEGEGGFKGKPQALAALFVRGCKGDAKKFVELCKAFGLPEEREALASMVGSGPEQAGLGDHPEVLADFLAVGCGASAADFKNLSATFKGKDGAAGLKRLVDTGGLADPTAKSDCLGQLLAHGAGDPAPDADTRAKSLLKLCTELDGPTCIKLSEVVKEGGLGQQPESFAHLVGISCKGNAANLKDFVGAFDTKDKREGLARMTSTGGLGAENTSTGQVVVDPRCLARLVDLGRPDADSATLAEKSGSFATLCAAMDGPACANLSKLVKDGGLGTDPDVLGHLVGTGCQGDGVKLKALATSIGNDGPAQVGLKKLVKDAGFGTQDSVGLPTATDPKCLAEMLNTGCEGKPAELVTLVKALGDGDRSNLKEMMKSGGLGTKPEVLGNSYKFGCQTDPYDPSSAKNPAMLKNLATAFGAPGDAPKLKELLDQGGLGDPAKPEWLGKVMRDAFTDHVFPPPTPPSNKAQDPGKLKDLHTAFTGNMPKLKQMFTAMGSMPPSCGDDDEPGKAFQNVHKSANVPINLLKTQFFDTLEAHSLAPGVLPNPPGGAIAVATLTLPEMIQNAASFEFDPVLPPDPDNLGGPPAYVTDVGHVMKRHNRRAPNRETNPDNNTSFFPKYMGDATIRVIIAASIADCLVGKAKTPLNDRPNPPAPPAAHPPTIQNHLNQQWKRQYIGVVGNGYVGAIGFKRKAPNGVNGPVQVGQYYPTGGPDVVGINAKDLQKLLDALNK